MGSKKFIKNAIKQPGALHKETHTPIGKKIPEKKIEKAEHSKNPKERERAKFAQEFKGFSSKPKSAKREETKSDRGEFIIH